MSLYTPKKVNTRTPQKFIFDGIDSDSKINRNISPGLKRDLFVNVDLSNHRYNLTKVD